MAKSKKLASKASELVSWRPKPTLTVDVEDCPAIKDWKIGKTYTLQVKARMVEINSGDEYDDEHEENQRPINARFRVTDVKEA